MAMLRATVTALLLASSAWAGEHCKQVLTPETIREVRAGAFTGVPNAAVLEDHDTRYNHRLRHGPVLDQGAAGHCWIYGAHAMVVANALEAGTLPRGVKLSANYVLYWYTQERVKGLMKGILDGYSARTTDDEEVHRVLSEKLEEGGQFGYYRTVVERHGLVPERAMPPTAATTDSETLFRDIKDELARFSLAVENLRRAHASPRGLLTPGRRHSFLRATEALQARAQENVRSILDLHLGAPPHRFKHGGTTITPEAYARDVLSFDPADYVAVSAYPVPGAGSQAYEVEDLSTDGTPGERAVYLNVSAERYMALINSALSHGASVLTGLDTAGPMDDEHGILHPNHKDTTAIYRFITGRRRQRLTRNQRIITGSQGVGHVMVLVGFDDPEDGSPIVKYRAQNSWGADSGDRGYYHMYREWLEIFGRDAVIPRALLSAQERALLASPVHNRAFDRLVE